VNLLVAKLVQNPATIHEWRGLERIPFQEVATIAADDPETEALLAVISADPLFRRLMNETFAGVVPLDVWNRGRAEAPAANVHEHPEWTTVIQAADADYGVSLPEDAFRDPRISLFWETNPSVRRLGVGWLDGRRHPVLSVAGGECGHFYRGSCSGGTCLHCRKEWIAPPGREAGWVCACLDTR
jgi:hypothetical protein